VWLKLNEGTGTAIDNATGTSATDGVAVGSPAWAFDAFSVNVHDGPAGMTTDGAVTVTQGKLECLSMTSVDFDGANDYITFSAITLDNDWSFSCWFNADEFSNNVLIGSDNRDDEIRFDSITALQVNINGQGTNTTTISGLATGQWFHFAYTRDDSTGVSDVYINGVFIGTATFSATNDFVFDRIGKAGSFYWDGDIRDVRIYDDIILSADQIASLYSGSFPDGTVKVPSTLSVGLKLTFTPSL